MTYRSASKLSALVAIAVLLWPSPHLLASDCACPKPKVKITAIHTITATSGTPVKVIFAGVEVPPEAEPVAMERDKEYALTITLDPANTNFECSTDVDLTFPHCTIEYSRDNGATWIRGARTSITAYDNAGAIGYAPAAILIRITAPPSDSATNAPAPGSAATPQTTPPAYAYDATNKTTVQAPPGLGLEIPMGAAFTSEGYRSAGLLVNYGAADSSFAAPSNLHYNAITAVASLVLQHDVINGSSQITEKHYVAPQGGLRVRGWNSAGKQAAAWTGAAETLVEVYDPDQYEAGSNAFSGAPHSYYRLEVATGNGLAAGFRLVQSNRGRVAIRSFQASTDGNLLLDTKDSRTTESLAVPLTETTWQSAATVREGGAVVSSVTGDYALLGARYLALSRTEDPVGTTYTSYHADGGVLSVSRPDGSWSYHTYDGNETITYSPWLSSFCLVQGDGWALPASGMAVKTVSYENLSGSTSHSYLVDLANPEAAVPMSGGSVSISTGSALTRTTRTLERGAGDTVSSYSLSYADGIADRFLAGRLRMTWDHTGQATLYQYERGAWDAPAFTPDSSGTDVSSSAITGYIADPDYDSTTDDFTAVPAHSTKAVTITTAQGIVREETHICDAADSFALALARDHQYEADGWRRHTGVKIGGVFISKTEYISPAVTRESDQDGTVTETETDAAGEVIRSTTLGNAAVPAVTTTYQRSGLITTTRVNGRVVAIETRDAAGRMVSSTDASGAVIETAYAAGGRIVTRTAPGGVTVVAESHYDGQAVSTTGSGTVARYHDYAVDSTGRVTTTTTTLGSANSSRATSVTRNRDGSTASESAPDPAGGAQPVLLTYQYASSSAALLRVSSSAADTAAQVRLDPATSAVAAMGHYSLSGLESAGTTHGIESADRLTETTMSYVLSGSPSVWNRQTVTRAFHTVGSDASHTRTSLDALAPITVDGGLRWTSSITNGTTTVTTTRDSFFSGSASVISTDDSATTTAPDAMTVTNHGRTISNSAYGTANPETMAYDAAGRLFRHTSPTGAVTIYNYNSAGRLASAVDHAGKVTNYTYYPHDHPAAGLPRTTSNPNSEVTESLYNTRGQVIETKGSGTQRVTYHYNDLGERDEMRTYRSANSTGDLTRWSYYPATGLLYQKIDADLKAATFTYHSSGSIHTRVRVRSTAVTHTTTYTHNPFGNLTGIDYSDSTPDVAITPDRLGRPSQIIDGSGTREQTYHPVTGGLDGVTYGNSGPLASRAVNYNWDASLRPAGYEVSGGDPAAVLTYDNAGRLETVASYGSTHTHGYIPGTGTLAGLTTEEGATLILTRTLNHDRMGRLFGIITTDRFNNTISRHGYTLDAAGRRVHAARENGQRWDYGYDDTGQVTSGVKKFPSGDAIPGHTFAYQYDGAGNRSPGDETHWSVTQGGTGTGVKYTTNALNQYTTIATEGGRFILGEAPQENDVFINGDTIPAARAGDIAVGLGFYWQQITGDNSTSPLWSTDSIVSGGVTLTGHTWTPAASVLPAYDFDGNLTNDGRWDYTWDAENRLTRMTTTTAAATAGVPRQRLDFIYDFQGRRISKTLSTSANGTTWTFSSSLRFLYDGWNLIAEYSAPSETSTTLTLQESYLWGLDLSGTPQGAGGVGGLLAVRLFPLPLGEGQGEGQSTDCYPCFDGNGNISAWVDSAGAVLARMDYSPFGQLIAHYKFTAATTLSRLHFGFSTKYTDPETGLLYYGHRYYDPVTGRWQSRDPIGERGGLNLYGFVGNDGVGRRDFLGREFGYMAEDVKCSVVLELGHTWGIIARAKSWNAKRRAFEAEEPNHKRYPAQMSGIGCALPFLREGRTIDGYKNQSPYESIYPIPDVPKNDGFLGATTEGKHSEPAQNGGFNPVNEGVGRWDRLAQTHGFLAYVKESWDAAILSGKAMAASNYKYIGGGESKYDEVCSCDTIVVKFTFETEKVRLDFSDYTMFYRGQISKNGIGQETSFSKYKFDPFDLSDTRDIAGRQVPIIPTSNQRVEIPVKKE